MQGSHCLRIEQDSFKFDRRFNINHAKEECSKNQRCVGIETYKDTSKFALCLDSIYTSTGWEKYQNVTRYLYKKSKTYGKYIQLVRKKYI